MGKLLWGTYSVAAYLSPRQVGMGGAGGFEEAARADMRFLENMNNDSIIVKLDFYNDFSDAYRDEMLHSAFTIFPMRLRAWG